MDLPGWERQKRPVDGDPYCWLQWKGTDACMDFHCRCGATGHIDGAFIYYAKCSSCGTVYMLNGHVELVELTPEESTRAHIEPVVVDTDDDD